VKQQYKKTRINSHHYICAGEEPLGMKRLENLWLRSAWKFRRVFRLEGQTIAPIQWGKPLLTSIPDKSLDERLDDSQKRRLQNIVEEARAYLGQGPGIPSFTDLFPRERIVYLSPDAEEVIEDVQEHDVFVLGGIVDRVPEKGIPRKASLETAIAEEVRSMKLPLDKYVTWKSGTKFLTLTAVFSILRNTYNSGGDWETALRNFYTSKSAVGLDLADKELRY
ncbi:tRNA (guanine-N(1)-)-methyltransferase, partial [Teladorsagia circumcincta]